MTNDDSPASDGVPRNDVVEPHAAKFTTKQVVLTCAGLIAAIAIVCVGAIVAYLGLVDAKSR